MDDLYDEIADLMMRYGPDGHVDGCDQIAEFAQARIAQARRDALEEAAKVCELIDGRGSYADTDLDDAFENGRLTCAEAVRALIDQKPPEKPTP